MRGEGGFLPSCHIFPSRLPNCWSGVLSVFAKNQGCQFHLPNYWRCSKRGLPSIFEMEVNIFEWQAFWC